MAIVQQNPATNDIAKLITNVNKAYLGQNDITITNYDGTGAPQVTAGATFDNNGTQWVNDALATPTGYAGIANSTAFYLYYDESGNVFIYAETIPVWSDAKFGWYNGNDRALFSMYKDTGGTLYQNKWKIGIERELLNRVKSLASNYMHGSLTRTAIFTQLDPFIPSTGNMMEITGGIETLTPSIVNRVERLAVGQMRFYGVNFAAGVITANTATLNSPSTVAAEVSLSW